MNLFLYLSVALLWGSSWFAIKFQLGLVPESVSLAWRFFLASFILFIFCLIFKKKLPTNAKKQKTATKCENGVRDHREVQGVGALMGCLRATSFSNKTKK